MLAGGRRKIPESKAMSAVHGYSEGNARKIDNLMTDALTIGAQQKNACHGLRAEIESLYEKYPEVLGVFDMESSVELTEEECAALIKVMELRNKLMDMELQSVYFRGCYDSVGFLKKSRNFITD